MIRFVPTKTGFAGQVTLQVHAWDGSVYTHGSTVNLNKTHTGGTTPFSTAVLTGELFVNDAPTQTPPAGGITLSTIHENVTSTPVSVPTLLGVGDAHASDADKGATVGLALTGAAGPGTWQYQLGNGWQTVPAVSATAALLLQRGAALRFVPTPNQLGTATLTWVAWDQTQGTAGAQFNSTASGGATAFSSASATATLNISAASGHQAPAWNGSGAALTPVAPNATNPPGDTVADVFGPFFADPGTPVGIAVTGLSGTGNGTWQYFNGTQWTMFAMPSVGKAVLLTATEKIRFVPKPGFLGTATLTAYAWDGTSTSRNLNGKLGGNGAFGATPLIAVCLVNTSPTLTA